MKLALVPDSYESTDLIVEASLHQELCYLRMAFGAYETGDTRITQIVLGWAKEMRNRLKQRERLIRRIKKEKMKAVISAALSKKVGE